MLNDQLQNYKDRLKSSAAWDEQDCERFWKAIEHVVKGIAAQQVHYSPDEDAWHGPTAAVWSAAFVAALVGCSLRLG
jgi:hypothetical protein